jgi:hypothetical protein
MLLAGLAVAGCGGGGSTTNGGSEVASKTGTEGKGGKAPMSKAKASFVAKANTLCDQRRKTIEAKVGAILEAAQGTGFQEAVLQRMVEKAIGPGMEAEADELRKLQAPPGDGAKVDAITAKIDATVSRLRKNPKVIVTSNNVFGEAQNAARAYGVARCARAS